MEAEAMIEAELFETASSASGGGRVVAQVAASNSSRARGVGGAKQRREEKELERIKKDVAKRAPKYIVMCGLPGAGKSTFSHSLEASTSACWVRANQDDFKRKGYEDLLRQTVPLVRQGKTHLVVDRCNSTKAERSEVLDMLGHPLPKDIVCIFFDFPASECKRRAAERENHPTIRKGGGARIIDAQAKQFESPEVAEGFGSVEFVRSFDDADRLLRKYGVNVRASEADVHSVQPLAEQVVDGNSVHQVAAVDLPRENSGLHRSISRELPSGFANWLREELEKEMVGDDFDGIYAAVEVILAGAADDPDALEGAADVLREAGAPCCAESLKERWGSWKGGYH
jgi:predicted kinase